MHVLVVDDSPTQRALWLYTLISTGLPVVAADKTDTKNLAPGTVMVFTAKCGEEAAELLKSTRIDLLVTDIEMPGMDGWQLAKIAHGAHMTLPILVVSSTVQTGQAPRPGLNPLRTHVISKNDRDAAVTLAKKYLQPAKAN
jgi:CheY-like chemotaxis protein